MGSHRHGMTLKHELSTDIRPRASNTSEPGGQNDSCVIQRLALGGISKVILREINQTCQRRH